LQYLFEIENETGGELIKPEVSATVREPSIHLAHAGQLKLRYRLSEEEYFHIYNDGIDFFADPNNAKEKSVFCPSWPYGPLPVHMEYKEPEPSGMSTKTYFDVQNFFSGELYGVRPVTPFSLLRAWPSLLFLLEGMLYFVRAAAKPQRKNWPWTNRGSQTVRFLWATLAGKGWVLSRPFMFWQPVPSVPIAFFRCLRTSHLLLVIFDIMFTCIRLIFSIGVPLSFSVDTERNRFALVTFRISNALKL
jgi:hypothetical protein